MRRWIALLFFGLGFLGLGAAAANAEPAPITCDQPFMAQIALPDRAQVIGTDRLYFVKDGDACPNDTPACRRRGYVTPGDVLLTGGTKDDYTCAYFPNHARGVSGWVRTDHLKALPAFPRPTLADWAGVWTDDNDTIRLTLRGAQIVAEGEAYPGTAPPAPGTPPDSRMGGAAAPLDNFVLFDRKQGRHDCIVSLTLMGDALEVADNMDCGGAKARFDGEYHKVK